MELTYKYKAAWGFTNLSYAHSAPTNNVSEWAVPGDIHTAIDAAKDQLTGLLDVKLTPVVEAAVNATYLSKRYTYTPLGNIQEYAAGTLLNGNVTLNFKPITVLVGAYDILNKKQPVLPAYYSGVDGLDTQGLEGFVKVKYNF